MTHLKKINCPETWKINRKDYTFITRSNPGPHNIKQSIPLVVLLRDVLKLARNLKETKVILNNEEVLVDGVVRKAYKFPVGLFDIIEIPKIKMFFRGVLDKKGRLDFIKTDKNEANLKIAKIVGKHKIKKKTQLNCNDGRNIYVEKDEFKVGDSLLISLPKQEIKKHFKFEKGAVILLTAGKHSGKTGILEDILGNKITYKDKDKDLSETIKEYAFVIGKEKPEIKIE